MVKLPVTRCKLSAIWPFNNVCRCALLANVPRLPKQYDIRVCEVNAGYVAGSNIRPLRTASQQAVEQVWQGLQPLMPNDVVAWGMNILQVAEGISITQLQIVPTAQRILTQNDREWTRGMALQQLTELSHQQLQLI